MHVTTRRHTIIDSLFPAGVPRLWCPPLTHFRADGSLDQHRICRHLEAMSPSVQGVLVPGSTGEGWDLTDPETRQLLSIVLDAARDLDLHVLIGVLRHDVAEILAAIRATTDWLCESAGTSSPLAAMTALHVVGYTVCPPRGAELSQETLYGSLSSVLELGHPTAIYQLPQVTCNEISPETAAQLAAQYANFFLLKDTSGEDRIVLSGVDLQGVFAVRGAEGTYARWVKASGGPYDGFLLSSANCLARELAAIFNLLDQGQPDAARSRSQRIEQVVAGCFEIVRDHGAANPFTNANKILDQVMAYGPACLRQPSPYLRGGRQLPIQFVERALELAAQFQLVPERGYLDGH
jgi:4-hydroxy-tetrahydrodipicolinate synthase